MKSAAKHLILCIPMFIHNRVKYAWGKCAKTHTVTNTWERLQSTAARGSLWKLFTGDFRTCCSGVELMEERCVCVCTSVYACIVLPCLHWMTACKAVWTGRCRFGSCVCWGSAVWPASSPAQWSDSASYSGPPLLGFAVGVGMDNSFLSPLCTAGRKGGKMLWKCIVCCIVSCSQFI